jgi:hypothetical protein
MNAEEEFPYPFPSIYIPFINLKVKPKDAEIALM